MIEKFDEKCKKHLDDAFHCLKRKDWKNARNYCDIVLSLDPECGMAYIGKLLSCAKLRDLNELQSYLSPFNKEQMLLWDKAMNCSGLEEKATLIKLQDQRQQNVYNEASRIAEYRSEWEKAAHMFQNIRDYQDASERADMCLSFASLHRDACSLNNLYRPALKWNCLAKIYIILSYVGLFLLGCYLIPAIRGPVSPLLFTVLVIDAILTIIFVLKVLRFGKVLKWCGTLWLADDPATALFLYFVAIVLICVVLGALLCCTALVLIGSPICSILFYKNLSRNALSIKLIIEEKYIATHDQLAKFEKKAKQHHFLEKQLEKMLIDSYNK